MEITLTVNGTAKTVDVPGNALLVDVLRESLGLTGTHVGCDTSQCGACVVHMNGDAVKSCTVLAGQASAIRTTCIRCRRRSATTMHCSAASARRA